jgi:hypothetical protein
MRGASGRAVWRTIQQKCTNSWKIGSFVRGFVGLPIKKKTKFMYFLFFSL